MIRQAAISLGDESGAVDWPQAVDGRPLLDALVAELAAFGLRDVLLWGPRARQFAASHDGRTVCGAGITVVADPRAAVVELAEQTPNAVLLVERPYRLCDLARFLSAPLPGKVRRLVDGKGAATGVALLAREAIGPYIAGLPSEPAESWPCTGAILDFGGDPIRLAAALRRPAAFLDRDGVINIDHGYVHRPEDLQFTPTAVAGIRLLNRAGYRVLVVTNQSGVARGYYGTADVERFHDHLQSCLQEQGAHVDAFYYSPHHPDGSVAEYTGEHDDRKPGAGMLRRAMHDWPTAVERSFLIGDKPSDVEAAARVGLPAVRVPTDTCDLAAEAAALVERFAVRDRR